MTGQDAESARIGLTDARATATVAGNSVTVAAWTVISRISGLGRVAAIAVVLGPTYLGNTYQATNLVPNLVFELLTGSLIAGLIVPPILRHLARRDPERAERVAREFLGVAVVVFAAAAVLLALAAPFVLDVIVVGVDDPATAAAQEDVGWLLLVLFAPQVVLYAVAGIGAAVQNSRGHFALAAGAPAIENVVIIVTLVVYVVVFGTDSTVESVGSGELLLLGLGTTLGVGLHAGAQWLGAAHAGITLVPRAGLARCRDSRDHPSRAVVARVHRLERSSHLCGGCCREPGCWRCRRLRARVEPLLPSRGDRGPAVRHGALAAACTALSGRRAPSLPSRVGWRSRARSLRDGTGSCLPRSSLRSRRRCVFLWRGSGDGGGAARCRAHRSRARHRRRGELRSLDSGVIRDGRRERSFPRHGGSHGPFDRGHDRGVRARVPCGCARVRRCSLFARKHRRRPAPLEAALVACRANARWDSACHRPRPSRLRAHGRGSLARRSLGCGHRTRPTRARSSPSSRPPSLVGSFFSSPSGHSGLPSWASWLVASVSCGSEEAHEARTASTRACWSSQRAT